MTFYLSSEKSCLSMPRDKEVDVMGLLLSEEVEDDIQEVEQLNCLIYSDSDNVIESKSRAPQEEPIWKTENDRFTVQIWETKGNIRIKFLSKPKTKISLQHLANVALNAIMDDLKKATP